MNRRQGDDDFVEENIWDMSQSQGSAASSAVNSTTVKLANANLTGLLWSSSLPYIVSNIVFSLAQVVDLMLIVWYCGFVGLMNQSAVIPLEAIIVEQVAAALASSASSFISKALAKNKVAQANRYYSQFMFLGVIWAVLAILLFATWYGVLFQLINGSEDQADGSVYLLITLILGPITRLFAISVGPFLAIENRVFLNMTRQIVLGVAFMALNCVFFPYVLKFTKVDGNGMWLSALSMSLACLIVDVWMILVILKKPVLGVPLRGCLKFTWHRTWPMNKKIVGRIFLFALPVFLFNIGQPLTMLICNILINSTYTDSTDLMIVRASLVVYIRLYAVFMSVPQAFYTGFSSVAGFNLAMGNYGRVRSLLKGTALWMLVISVIIGIITFFFCDAIVGIIIPEPNERFGDAAVVGVDFIASAPDLARWACLVPAVMGPFYLVYAIANLEGRIVLLVLTQIIRPVAASGVLIFMSIFIRDGAHYELAMPVADATTAVAGFLYYFYYLAKYDHLAKVEESRLAKNTLEQQLAGIAEIQEEEPRPSSGV